VGGTVTPYWQSACGRFTVYRGDCLEILPTLGPVDAVVTDPPFGIDYSSGHGSAAWGDGSIHGDTDVSVRNAALMMTGQSPALVFGSWK